MASVSDRDRDEFNFRRNKPEFADQGDSGMSSSWEDSNPYGSSGGSLGSSDFGSASAGSGGGLGAMFGATSSEAPSADSMGGLGGFDAGGGLGGFGSDSAFGGGAGFGGFGGMQQEQAQSRPESIGDVAGVIGSKALKSSAEAAKTFTASVSDANSRVFNKSAYFVILSGASYLGIVLLLMLMSLFAGFKNTGSLVIGGILAAGTGLLVLSITQESAKAHAAMEDGGEQIDLNDDPPGGYQDFPTYEPEESNIDSFASDSGDISSDDDDDNWWDSADDEEEGSSGELVPDAVDVDDAISNLGEVPAGMYTRQYLYEQYSKILPKVNPSFSSWTDYDLSDDMVVSFESYLIEAAEVLNAKNCEDIQITELRSNDFLYEITLTRPDRVEVGRYATEFSNIYASRDVKDEFNQPNKNVYTRTHTSGRYLTIMLFKGDGGGMVSVADTWGDKRVKDMFLNPDIQIPMVLGVNEMGIANIIDFSEVYSALMSGLPRKGKSWAILMMLMQMCAFSSPREVTLYIGDNKAETSDFYGLQLPHIKQFESDPNRILEMLKWVVQVEGVRRKKIIGGDGGEVNYNNYIKANPAAVDGMPRLYVLVDEMMSLAESFEDGDKKKEYFGYLKSIVSQLPGMGIYFIGIPHKVKDYVIPRAVYTLIPFNINVGGDVDDVTDALQCKPAAFPYRLSQVGESAAKVDNLNGAKPFYNKGTVITKDKKTNDKIFEFIRYMWAKLDHDFYHGPRIDMHDQKNDRFDNYECNCKSHGGVKTLGSRGESGSVSMSDLGIRGTVGASGPRGGFDSTSGGTKFGSSASLRRDGNESMPDVAEDWDIPDFNG